MDVHEIKARWEDLYHTPGSDDSESAGIAGRRQQRLGWRAAALVLTSALALALFSLLVFAISRVHNTVLLVLAVVLGAALFALLLYGASVCCTQRDLAALKEMAGADDSRGAYDEIA